MPTILLVDDEAAVRTSIRTTLEDDASLRVIEAATAAAMRAAIDAGGVDVVLLDVFLGDGNGVALLPELRRRNPELTVVMISGGGDIPMALEAVRGGAWDFLEKPLARGKLQVTVRNALAASAHVREASELRRARVEQARLDGESPALRAALEVLDRAAQVQLPVLITGESGTGKEIAARRVHALSPRFARPMVKLNCAAVPPGLLESELFGHVRGSFTGALADRRGLVEAAEGGTLFLDEIGDMDPSLQAKLLRVLQDGEYTRVGETAPRRADVRVVSATHQPLRERIREGKFREDLFYRLAGVEVRLPPLRERPGDAALLARRFVEAFCVANNRRIPEIAPAALAELDRHPFPGNVRELRHVIERTLVLGDGDVIERFLLDSEDGAEPVGTYATVKRSLLRQHLERRLAAHGGSRPALARELGVHLNNLYRLLKELGVSKGR